VAIAPIVSSCGVVVRVTPAAGDDGWTPFRSGDGAWAQRQRLVAALKRAHVSLRLLVIPTVRDKSEIRLVYPGIYPHRDKLFYIYPSSCTQNIPSYRNKWLRSILTKLYHHPMSKVVSVAKPGFNAPARGLRPCMVAARKTKSAPLPNLLHAKSMHSQIGGTLSIFSFLSAALAAHQIASSPWTPDVRTRARRFVSRVRLRAPRHRRVAFPGRTIVVSGGGRCQ